MKTFPKFIVISTCTALVLGCSASKPKPGLIAKQWSDNTRQLGISPIYPPRERFEPGDIYLAVTVPASKIGEMPDGFYTTTPIRYGQLDLTSNFTKEQQRRQLPAMPSYVNESGTAVTPWNMQDYPAAGGRLNGIVAFPGYSFASATDAELGINVTNGAWGGLLGASSNSKYLISYSVPAAEYISLPLDSIMAVANVYYNKNKDQALRLAKTMRDGLPENLSSKVTLSMIVATEIFYARAIDIAISAKDSSSATLSATTMKLIDLGEKKAKLQEELLKLKSPAAPAAPAAQNKIALLESQISELQSTINTATQSVIPNIPGATGSITRSSATGVTLRQVFKYPVAIGYRGVSYNLEKDEISTDVPGYNMIGGASE